MKAVILAGGFGTRLSEETDLKPKPMIEIGLKPILWHIMKIYSTHSINEFIICLGYKGYMIKEYFANYFLHMSDVTLDLRSNRMDVHRESVEPWKVTLVDTGEESLTGGRLRRVRPYLDDSTFCFTYGDGVGDIDVTKSIEFHRKHGKLATLTAVRQPSRFGDISVDGDRITEFREKEQGVGSWINGGFFVLEPEAIDYVDGDRTSWEREPLERLAHDDQIRAFFHHGFWQPMDTLREKRSLEEKWSSGKAPWKIWE
jgi:glucose-1-phosphate cytidylyltransferase